MIDSPIDPNNALRSYLEALQPYLVAMQQAYDHLVDLGASPAPGAMIPSHAPPESAPRSKQYPQLGSTHAHPARNPGANPSASPLHEPVRGGQPLPGRTLWGNPAVLNPDVGSTSHPITTSYPFQQTMWPSRLPFRTETLPQNPIDDHDHPDSDLAMIPVSALTLGTTMAVSDPTSRRH